MVEKCPGCGGVFKDPKTGLGVIERVHRCSGHLLQPKPIERAEPPKRAISPKRTEALERKQDQIEPTPDKRFQAVDAGREPGFSTRTIDERVADCPVCTARRAKERKKKERQRIKKTIPGQR